MQKNIEKISQVSVKPGTPPEPWNHLKIKKIYTNIQADQGSAPRDNPEDSG